MFFYYLLFEIFQIEYFKNLIERKNKYHFKKVMILNNNKITKLEIYKKDH